MNTAGIICEYNPFHSAHAWHIAETRRLLGEDAAVVCVMSGNFVQRGEPAMFEKHARAEAAVLCGADLVVELPLPWAMAPAERFALGGVAVLDALGVCKALSFGSECGSAGELEAVADCLADPATDALIAAELQKGIPYAAARENALRRLAGSSADLITQPNNILGVEYLKALKKLGSAMTPLAVPRTGAEHDGTEISGRFASASALRAMFTGGGDPWRYIPEQAAGVFRRELSEGRAPVTLASLETAVLARLRTLKDEDWLTLPEDAEGLSLRLKRFGKTEAALEEVLQKTKSKRYTMAKIKRMTLSAFLGMQAEDCEGLPPYIRVLAFNATGRTLLHRAVLRAKLPVLTRPTAARRLGGRAERVFTLEAAARDLYALGFPSPEMRAGGEEWRKTPIKIEVDTK